MSSPVGGPTQITATIPGPTWPDSPQRPRRAPRQVGGIDRAVRVVVADDSVLLREGLVRLLAEAGADVVAAVGDAPALSSPP